MLDLWTQNLEMYFVVKEQCEFHALLQFAIVADREWRLLMGVFQKRNELGTYK